MEAMTAASVAALTVYDMCKAVSKDIVIKRVQLESKAGGKSGTYTRRRQSPNNAPVQAGNELSAGNGKTA